MRALGFSGGWGPTAPAWLWRGFGADRIEGLEAVFFHEPFIWSYPEAGKGSRVFRGLKNFSPERVARIEALFPKRRP